MATVLTQTLSTNTAITLDLSSLATSSTFLTGVESTEVDNTTTNYVDALVQVNGITGGATAPTIGQQIGIYVWGADTSLATKPIDTLDGTSSAETLSHSAVLNSFALGGVAVVTAATGSLVYPVKPFSVAALFDGVMPKFWGLFVAHNHTGALAATQSALFSFNGVTHTAT